MWSYRRTVCAVSAAPREDQTMLVEFTRMAIQTLLLSKTRVRIGRQLRCWRDKFAVEREGEV